jgi:hypothetical protein
VPSLKPGTAAQGRTPDQIAQKRQSCVSVFSFEICQNHEVRDYTLTDVNGIAIPRLSAGLTRGQ